MNAPPIPAPAPASNAPPDNDGEHLRLLAIFHFVHSFFMLAGLAFNFVHYLAMQSMFKRFQTIQSAPDMPQGVTFVQHDFVNRFIPFYLCFGAILLMAFVAQILTGFFLLKRRQKIFCFLVSGVNCLFVPMGTVLGIFTIFVLNRPSVQAKFESPAP